MGPESIANGKTANFTRQGYTGNFKRMILINALTGQVGTGTAPGRDLN